MSASTDSDDLGVPMDSGADAPMDVPMDAGLADTSLDTFVPDSSLDAAGMDRADSSAPDAPPDASLPIDAPADTAADVPAAVDGPPPYDAPPPMPRRCAPLPTPDGGVDVAAPRAIAPLSATRVTSQRPTLRWALPADVTGARVELCTDCGCSHVLARLDVTGTSVRPTALLPPGVVYWRLFGRSAAGTGWRPSPVWEFVVGHRDAPHDTSFGTLKDFDADGYDDLLVQANLEVPRHFNFRVYCGNATGSPSRSVDQSVGRGSVGGRPAVAL